MLHVKLSKDVEKILLRLPKKHSRQIAERIMKLRVDPEAQDTKELRGYPFRRADSGEYRIIYSVIGDTLFVEVLGKRNDNEVYRKLKRKW